MFKNCNTDCIKLLQVFSATVTADELNKKICTFGETNFYQLGIKLNGRTKVLYNGTAMDYSGGSVLYLPQESVRGIPYNKVYTETGDCICIFFTSEHALIPSAKIYNACEAQTVRLFRDILKAFKSGNELRAKALFYSILSELDFEESKHGADASFGDVMAHINANIFDTNIDVSALAERYGCSAEHFRHKFRRKFNIPPKKYILLRRLNSAKELLLNSDLSVADIAKRTGFADSNYFSRYFKQETGCTPMQFKKNCKKFL